MFGSILTIVLFLGSLIHASEDKPPLVLNLPSTVLQGIEISPKVIEDCDPAYQLPRSLTLLMKTKQKKTNYKSIHLMLNGTKENAHNLKLEIIDIFARNGGLWSGAKKVAVRGSLQDQNGLEIGSFYLVRGTIGGSWIPGLQDTGEMLEIVIDKISPDIRKWLKKPEMGSFLGEAEATEKIKGMIESGQWPPPQ